MAVLDRSLIFPIPDFQTLQQTTYLQDAVIRDLLIHVYDQIDREEVWVAYQRFSEISSLVADILSQDLLATKIRRRSVSLFPPRASLMAGVKRRHPPAEKPECGC